MVGKYRKGGDEEPLSSYGWCVYIIEGRKTQVTASCKGMREREKEKDIDAGEEMGNGTLRDHVRLYVI